MLVLGWHGGIRAGEADDQPVGYSTHDGAAVLLRDGELVAAIEEERLNRVKHSNFFPVRSIRFCLDRAGIGLEDIDFIALDAQESVVDEFVMFCALTSPDEPLITGRELIARTFEREFGVDVRPKLRFCKHHVAHVYSAIFASGHDRGLSVALDGEGDQRSGMVTTFNGQALTTLREYTPAQSLGAFYTSCIAMLGYRRFDEYKVMGLAPYGHPARYRSLFEQFYTLKPGGDFEIVPDAAKLALFAQAGLLPHIRRKGQPFTELHKDLAASIQETLEKIAMHVFTHYAGATGERKLSYSGGVAHNCTLNGKLLCAGLFDDVFVQPAAHDAGNALGAALATAAEAGTRLGRNTMPHLYLGSPIGTDDEIGQRLSEWQGLVSAERCSDIAQRAAALLAEGKVLAWVQGHSEFGPRSLGNRSILADARPAEFKHVINAMVKKREGYRPFAPSVIEERFRDYFEVPASCPGLPFMIFVVNVKEHMRPVLGAITHVDGTARVQTVSRESNPRYHALIEAFGQITGVPVVLNTSFNNDVEPIVDSVDDAVVCFLTTGIHYLVVGDYLVTKAAEIAPAALRSLVPDLRPHQKLVRRERAGHDAAGGHDHTIESTASSFFVKPRIPVSEDVFSVLLGGAGARTIDERCRAMGISDPARIEGLTREFIELWSRRAVVLQPA